MRLLGVLFSREWARKLKSNVVPVLESKAL